MNARGLGFAVALAAALPAAAAAVTVGTANDGNCFPFGCFARQSPTFFQQVYASSAFSGPITIDAIAFQRRGNAFFPLDLSATLDSATYAISFYLTDRAPATLGINPAANRGALLATFGSFALGGTTGPTLTLDGADFTYDPAAGNLLLDLTVTSFTAAGSGFAGFAADAGTATTARAYGFPAFAFAPAPLALVTEFRTAATSVPEPAAWATMAVGFGIVGGAMRRRRPDARRPAGAR